MFSCILFRSLYYQVINMKIKSLCCFLLLFTALLFSFVPASASDVCEFIVNTQEQGNTVYVYKDGKVAYTGTSDSDGVIRIENMEEGSYKAEFKDNTYQSFSFVLPYEGSLSLSARPKKMDEVPVKPNIDDPGTTSQNTDGGTTEKTTSKNSGKNTGKTTEKDSSEKSTEKYTAEDQKKIPFTGSSAVSGIISAFALAAGISAVATVSKKKKDA